MSITEPKITEALDGLIATARALFEPGGTEMQAPRLEALRGALREAVAARAVQQLDQELGPMPDRKAPR